MAENTKSVIRRLVRGPDGQMRLIFVDPKTGIPVQNPQAQGYNIIEPGNTADLADLGIDPGFNPFKPRDPRNHRLRKLSLRLSRTTYLIPVMVLKEMKQVEPVSLETLVITSVM